MQEETITGNKTLNKAAYQLYLSKGISYQQYQQQMAEDLALNPDLQTKEYINLNQRRMQRVEKTYTVSAALLQQVKKLQHKIHWIVITEHWCGDASQSLPVLHKVAAMSDGMIELQLVYRDQNNELMDQYLTNGTRSIPKLIQLDEWLNVTGIWGPRPGVAQKLVKELKANSATAATYASELHLWYAKDKQQELEKEIAQLLYRAQLFCADCLT